MLLYFYTMFLLYFRYITVLLEISKVNGTSRHGSMVSAQLLDVAIRVKTIRSFAANKIVRLLDIFKYLKT